MFSPTAEEKYHAPRDKSFVNFLCSILNKAKIKKDYVNLLVSDESLAEFSKAFTSKTFDVENNLEVYEQIGDVSVNKFLVWYMHKRFPFLKHPKGVKVVARLRINYSAKQTFYEIGNKLGFWPFISATVDERSKRMKHLIEDAFEAFIGCTEYLLDNFFRPGVGYAIVYDILESIFNDIDISLEYNKLYDAKTRLKELIDAKTFIAELLEEGKVNINNFIDFNGKFGKIKYKDDFTADEKRISRVIFFTQKHGEMVIGEGIANIKPDAQQAAAENALLYLKSRGISKPVPDFYNFK